MAYEGMIAETISINGNKGEPISAYVARPAAAKAPAVVVIQEIFGVNAVMRETADWLAGEGYLAIFFGCGHQIFYLRQGRKE